MTPERWEKVRDVLGQVLELEPEERSQFLEGACANDMSLRSMSRPANPYDNASCESFLKTLKREEVYATEYRDLDHLRENLAAFIDRYYNRVRLHSALGYQPPEEFEQAAALAATSQGATMSFFRHEEISLENTPASN
jgi:hypothetical protein